jgi:hypothetical protein
MHEGNRYGFFCLIEQRIVKVDTVLCIGLDPAFSGAEMKVHGRAVCTTCS